jgi:hypothetical protein
LKANYLLHKTENPWSKKKWNLTASVGNVQPTLKLRKTYRAAQLVLEIVSERMAGKNSNS